MLPRSWFGPLSVLGGTLACPMRVAPIQPIEECALKKIKFGLGTPLLDTQKVSERETTECRKAEPAQRNELRPRHARVLEEPHPGRVTLPVDVEKVPSNPPTHGIVVSDAERAIPIAYARATRGAAVSSGAATYLPLRLLQAGVIPIIFALSLLLLPQLGLSMLGAVHVTWAVGAATWYTAFLANPWEYGAVYFAFVVLFTYFYTSVTFEPHRVAENLQKSGAFVPGVRPGTETETYIGQVVNRITLPGAVFLGLLAVAPSIIEGLTGITTLLLGGTALLITVQVVLDLVRKVDAQVSLREY